MWQNLWKIWMNLWKNKKDFNQTVDQRLSALEKDVKQIKLLPTIKKELKNLE